MFISSHIDSFNPAKDEHPAQSFPEWDVDSLETREDFIRAIKNLRDEVEAIQQKIEGQIVVELPKKSIRAIIIGHVSEMKDGDAIYPSDIAFEHHLDPDIVEEVMDELLAEGVFR